MNTYLRCVDHAFVINDGGADRLAPHGAGGNGGDGGNADHERSGPGDDICFVGRAAGGSADHRV